MEPFLNSRDMSFAMDRLRVEARKEVLRSSLIRRVASGDKKAPEELHIGFWPFAREVRETKKEEESHASHWRKDALSLGLASLDGPVVAGVRRLIEESYTEDLPRFFSVLVGTEIIAEELSRFLDASEAFTELLRRRRRFRGDVHLIRHDVEPSHLEIDLDMARVYLRDDTVDLGAVVLHTIRLFGKAAAEVELNLLLPSR